ncbi:MAG: hypothetical protein CM15mP115_19990 [Alphaproteobacteria bacterium]|nr:MAG: hypothetical protein CM15mP115_19990 [Alphaproteobacteria bacterium]
MIRPAFACRHGPVRGNAAPAPAPATPLVDSAPEATVADGIVAIREGNFREAVAIWTPHAEAGNPAAHYGLGLVYSRDRGAGMPARPELSHRHYKAAAHRGHVDSIFELAFQYERGIGTEANTDHALAYYRVAAAKNHLNAQYNLAVSAVTRRRCETGPARGVLLGRRGKKQTPASARGAN